jgi:RNA polymerase sigma factor for flagellar operon FliA
MDRAQPWVSLDETILSGDRRRMTRQDVVEDNHAIHPDRETIRQDNLERLRKAFLQLSSREQKILYLYYFEELRLSEIAQLYELTEARICQIHAMAAAKLKVILATDNGG